MAAPAGAGSCRTGRRPRSGACSSTVGDAAPVPGAPRDAHGFAPCAFGETGPMAMGSRAMDRMNRVRPPTGPYGPWTVARWTGTPSSGPVHGPGVVRVAVPAWAFAWTTYLVPAWSMDQAGGSRDRPLMVLLAWAMCLVRRMDRGLSGWSTMTVRPYMVLRVGRMIGPACGPLAHSHDVDRKRAGHVGGPPASTWSIWPLVQGPGLRPWPTRRGLIVDRAVLDGPWSWLTPSSASDRPVRPTADTRRLRQDLFILRVAPR